MEVAEIGRKKNNQNVRDLQSCELKRLTEEMIEELQQQVLYIESKIQEKQLHLDNAKSKAMCMSDYRWSYGEKEMYKYPELVQKKMELEKLTFAHGAYRDNKSVLSFSSGEPEVNIHNLSYRMLHEARSMDGERHLLRKMNPKKEKKSGFCLEELQQEIWKLEYDLSIMKCRPYSINDREKIEKKLKELVMERDQLFSNYTIKGLLWNSLPSTKDLRNQIQDLEAKEEETREVISKRRKVIESNKRELKKAENETKQLRNAMLKIRQRKHKSLQTLAQLHKT